MRLIRVVALTAILCTGSALPAGADIIDFGVDILSSGSTTQLADGFWGDENGYSLSNSCSGLILVLCSQRSYDFGVNTAALADSAVESALLSFDFSGLGLLESYNVFAFNNGYQYLGVLGSQPLALSLNMFGDEIANGLLNIRVETTGLLFASVRLDGANLHIETPARVPEPATLMLTVAGLAAGAAFHRRRRR